MKIDNNLSFLGSKGLVHFYKFSIGDKIDKDDKLYNNR